MIKIIQLGVFLGFLLSQVLQAQEKKIGKDENFKFKEPKIEDLKAQVEQLTDMLNAYVRKAQTCDIQLTDSNIKLERVQAKTGKGK